MTSDAHIFKLHHFLNEDKVVVTCRRLFHLYFYHFISVDQQKALTR